MKQYEAMFLFDPTFGSSFEQCEAEIRRLMERAEAEILICRKWDERRLAYRIKGRKRGVYVLVYFKASPEKITPLERDAQLSEDILRLLVLKAENLSLDDMAAVFRVSGEQPAGAEDAAPPAKEAKRSGDAVAPDSAKVEAADKNVVDAKAADTKTAATKTAEEPATTD